LNVAVTVLSAFIVTVHVPVPVQAPLQPAKAVLPTVRAVRVTTVPLENWLLHVFPQLMPPGLLVTVPFERLGPAIITVSLNEGLTVKVRASEAAAPGLTTVTCAVPGVAMSLAGIAAVTRVLLTKVVVRFAPFQRTTAPDTKPLPFTVRVKAAPPAAALLGDNEVSLACGGGGGALAVKGRAFEAEAPGLTTVTCAVPGVAMSLAGIAAVSPVLLTKVVVRFAPFQRTTAPDTKPLPFTVRVKAAPPAAALLGDNEVSVAGGGGGGGGALAASCTMLPTDGTPLPSTMKSR
jgi:energy-converting hydrogenase Eha subunit G